MVSLIEKNLELMPCKCRSRFCSRCALGLGLELRTRVTPVLRDFNGVLMVTLTFDPEVFDGNPVQCFEYVRDHRVISEFVRRLKEEVHSRRYFCVVEWQKETEFPHFHICLDANFIDFETLCRAWNSVGPGGLTRMRLRRTGLGSIRFTKKDGFESRDHAIHYLLKYIIKIPEHGFPDWVLDYDGNVVRYQVSKGFFGTTSEKKEKTEKEVKERRRKPTVRERIAECGSRAVILSVCEVMLPDGEIKKRVDFLWSAPGRTEDILEGLHREWDGVGTIRIEGWEAQSIIQGSLKDVHYPGLHGDAHWYTPVGKLREVGA